MPNQGKCEDYIQALGAQKEQGGAPGEGRAEADNTK